MKPIKLSKRFLSVAAFLTISIACLGQDITWTGSVAENTSEERPYLGVFVTGLPPVVSAQLELDPEVGVAIEHLDPEGPAAKAGLKVNDILWQFDEQLLIGTKQIAVLIRNCDIGSVHEITYIRMGQKQTLEVTIGATDKFAVNNAVFLNRPLIEMGAMPGTSHFEGHRVGPNPSFDISIDRDLVGPMHLGEDVEAIFENVYRAAGDPSFPRMPTFVFRGNERVIDFVDDKGLRYSIAEKNGERQLKIVDENGEEIYEGVLDDKAMDKLPDDIRGEVSRIHKVIRVKRPGGNEI